MPNENTIEIINQNYIIEIDTPQYSILAENTINIDYNYAAKKPQINSVELSGNKSTKDLGLVDFSDIEVKENVSNKVITLSENSTDAEYPSAKCVNDLMQMKVNTDLSNLSEQGQAKFNEKANKSELDLKVNKSGDTMTGTLLFSGHSSAAIQANLDNRPDSNNIKYMDIVAAANNNRTGVIRFEYNTSNKNSFVYIFTANNETNALKDGLKVMYDSGKNDTFFDFPKCTTKATTTSSAASNKVAVVVQNYVNGSSWYRVWSDGWIEQGGVVKADSSTYNTGKTINLLKAFSNSNYNLAFGIGTQNNAGGIDFQDIGYSSKQTNNFSLRIENTTYLHSIDWRACGY